MKPKQNLSELAVFGGTPLFVEPKSTSNLYRPSLDKFLRYSKLLYEKGVSEKPLLTELERRLAAFHQASDCIAFCSGFWALAYSILAMRLPEKSEVVLPSLTYRRMPDLLDWLKLKPVYCEVDTATLAMTPELVAEKITPETSLILAVHPIVNCADVSGLLAMANASGVPILFDSVESVYEQTNAGRIGSLARAEVFSIHACKLINGFGGGYVTTNDAELASQLRQFRDPAVGRPAFSENSRFAMNSSLNEIHAAMALASLDEVDQQVIDNKARYQKYRERFPGSEGLRLVEFDETTINGYKNIVLKMPEHMALSRENFIKILNAENVLARPYYYPALHTKASKTYVAQDLPVTDELALQYVNFPCGYRVSTADIDQIADLVDYVFEHSADIAKKLGN